MAKKVRWIYVVAIALMIMVSNNAAYSYLKTPETVEIRFRLHEDPQRVAVKKEILKRCEQTYPWIRIKVEHTGYAEYTQKLLVEFVGKAAPDIIYGNCEVWRPLGERGVYEDLLSYIKESDIVMLDDYYEAGLADFSLPGKDAQYLVPHNSAPYGFYYNIDLFDKAGVAYPDESWTWTGKFLEAAKKLAQDTDGDGKIDQYAFYDMGSMHTLEFSGVWSWEGRWFNEERTKFLAHESPTPEAIQFFADLTINGINPQKSLMDKLGYSGLWWVGKVAMISGGAWIIATQPEQAPFRYDVMFRPYEEVRVTGVCSGAYGINSQSEHKDTAWKVIEYFLSPKERIHDGWYGGEDPSLKSILMDPDYWEFFQPPPKNRSMFAEILATARPLPYTSHWREVFSVMKEQLELIFLGQETAKEGMEKIKAEVDKILARPII
ncbi:MAG: extracellular solute-binding protein [Firmicutes bacterium]|nr:extracellular solute-binding protein [Bacillota bacterium]